jgi:hypothetical protein
MAKLEGVSQVKKIYKSLLLPTEQIVKGQKMTSEILLVMLCQCGQCCQCNVFKTCAVTLAAEELGIPGNAAHKLPNGVRRGLLNLLKVKLTDLSHFMTFRLTLCKISLT